MGHITVEISGGKAELTLRRPEVLNAMDFKVFDELAAAADEVNPRDDVRVVVVRGEGRSFSSGIDVTALGSVQGSLEEMIRRAQAGFRAMAALPMPTVAVVQGHAYGAGLQLALACDLRVVANDARLGLLEANYGLIPDLGGSTLLPRLVGPARAKRMIWLAERISGEEACAIGLADLGAAPAELDATADTLITALLAAPALPARETKALIERAHLVNTGEGMDAEAAAQARCMSSPNFGEALMAGLQRRASRG
jgi:enoyl-CoA hydratase/carnithine racemase